MKVRVTVTVDIDPDVWMREYGVERAARRLTVIRPDDEDGELTA